MARSRFSLSRSRARQFVQPDAARGSLHVATLASFALAQPLFDLLGGAPEFLLAHDLGPAAIVAVTLMIGVAIPGMSAVAVLLAASVHPRAGVAVSAALAGLFSAALALLALKWGGLVHGVAVVGTAGLIAVSMAVAYQRVRSLRAFLTWLAPGIVLFPLAFVFRPGVSSLVWPTAVDSQPPAKVDTPVVMIVFDGLPLTALLDEHHGFDRRRHPSFAALADQATWYRNATTVSDYTRWSVPAIVTGRVPAPASLPIAAHHGESLFTLLSSSHTIRLHEPISRLCAPTICSREDKALPEAVASFARTLSVVYLHAALPEEFESDLPPINPGWGQEPPDTLDPKAFWIGEGKSSRRRRFLDFVQSIGRDGATSPFYFVHVLLPHTPLSYLPTGQRFNTERDVPGLQAKRDRWLNDDWAVAQGYQLFLLQVEYVDALLGGLVARLREAGLYDRALIVVASDHGASFRAGLPFRGLADTNFMDILPVPLLIKAPHQQRGQLSDRNVETIDILPTIADLLGIQLPWRVDGSSAVGAALPRPAKVAYYENARRTKTFPASMLRDVFAAADRKLALFGRTSENPYRVPRSSPHHALIGRRVAELETSDDMSAVEFSLDEHGDFADVDPRSDFLPVYLAGRARWRDGTRTVSLAIGVNGTICATTRTYSFEEKRSPHAWTVVLPPDALRSGSNDLEVFVVGPEAPVLHRAYRSDARVLSLLSASAAEGLGARYEGLHEPERAAGTSFRWTNGSAKIVVPVRGRQPATALRVDLAMSGRDGKSLKVLLNGCELFNGPLPAGPWSRVFALSRCRPDASEIAVELVSDADRIRDSRDRRVLGVAVERVDLLHTEWPPSGAPVPETDRSSHIELQGISADGATVQPTASIEARVLNRGTAMWPAAVDLGDKPGGVSLGVFWFRRGDTAQPATLQRIPLPRTLFGGEATDVRFTLSPVAPDGTRLPAGPYEVWIGLIQEGVGLFQSPQDAVRKLHVPVGPAT